MKTVLITGATGLVGSHTIQRLLASEDYRIFALGTRKEKLLERYGQTPRVECFSNSELLEDRLPLGEVDFLIHCAFTRTNDPTQVASAERFTAQVFEKVKAFPSIGIVSISTRSVYKEPDAGTLNTEDSVISPSGAIGIAKYGCELMLRLMCSGTEQKFTILRLASVNEIKTDNLMVRPINVFVNRVLAGEPISVVGGMQVMSYIAPQDVAEAIAAVLALPAESWADVYNVGTAWHATDTLLHIAETVRSIGVEEYGRKPVEIQVQEKEVNMHAGLDYSRLHEATGWEPRYDLREMIRGVYELSLKR